MNNFGYSSMRREKLNFTVRIDRFSMRASKGTFASPQFSGPTDPDTKWSLFLEMTDYDQAHVIVRLNREGDEETLVSVKASVVDRFGSHSLTEETDLYFKEYTEAREVLTIAKGQLYGPFKRFLLLPGDSLTLACELVIGREHVGIREDDQQEDSVAAEIFASSNLVACNTLKFGHRFGDFKTLSRKGRLVSETFGGEWSLVVHSLDDFSQDFVELKLRREDRRNAGGRFVNVKLSNIGCLPHMSPFLCEKQMYFHGNGEEETRLLTISKREMSGLKKLLRMPGDALTITCEIVSYEEDSDVYQNKEDFLLGFPNHYGGAWWLAWWTSIASLLLLTSILSIVGWCNYVLPLINDSVLPFLKETLTNLVIWYCFMLLVRYCLVQIKTKAENIMRRKEERERYHNAKNNKSREMVPYKKQALKPHARQEQMYGYGRRDTSPYRHWDTSPYTGQDHVQKRWGKNSRQACYMNRHTGEFIYYSD